MHLTQIWTYPVKSCAGVPHDRARLGERGLDHDRHWMVVTPEGRMVTLREAPQLARVTPRPAGDHLEVTAPGSPPLALPFGGPGPRVRVRLWEGWADAVALPDASAWFSERLRTDVALVAVPEGSARRTDPALGARRLSFVDSAPLTVLGEASLADLDSRLGSPAGAGRFRPNLVFAGGGAYEEDAWRRVRIGAVPFDALGACERCMVVNLSPGGAYAKEPLATLARYRRRGRHVTFGQTLAHLGPGELWVGDAIEVTAYAEPDPR